MIDHFKNIVKKLETFNSFKLIMDSFKSTDKLEIYIAGGVVRNYFITSEFEIKDIDIFYKGDISNLLEIFKKNGAVEVGPFGSLRWFPLSEKIYFDIISIELFNNGVEKCSTINDVLKQFDFTANSVAYRLNDGMFFNPCNGLNDIKNKIIKMVRYDYPNQILSKEINISRTSILWFRILHYTSKLHFKVDENTKKWLVDNKNFYVDLNSFKKYFFDPVIDENILLELKIA